VEKIINMSRYFLLIFFLFTVSMSFPQSFLNGDFEINCATDCIWNMENSLFSSCMANTLAFGTGNSVDIQKIGCGYSNPQHGKYFISLSFIIFNFYRFEAVSMKLSSPLIKGRKYSISYYEQSDTTFNDGIDSLAIGISSTPDSFGAIIYKSLPPINHWIKRTFSFIAPYNADYITVKMCLFHEGWNFIDNFNIDTCLININLGNDTTLCKDQALSLDASFPDASYIWQDGSTNSTFNVIHPGIFWVDISKNSCHKRDSIIVNYTPLPDVNLGKDTTLCKGQTLILNAMVSHASYKWQDGSTDTIYKVTQEGIYWVDVSLNNCSCIDSIKVKVINCLDDCKIYIPNAFTPNDDGINDRFLVVTSCFVTEYRMIIFNRWGENIFESTDSTIGWDGKFKDETAQDGTYYYYLTAKKTLNSINLSGLIHLIR